MWQLVVFLNFYMLLQRTVGNLTNLLQYATNNLRFMHVVSIWSAPFSANVYIDQSNFFEVS